jgi:hypothetical protein
MPALLVFLRSKKTKAWRQARGDKSSHLCGGCCAGERSKNARRFATLALLRMACEAKNKQGGKQEASKYIYHKKQTKTVSTRGEGVAH